MTLIAPTIPTREEYEQAAREFEARLTPEDLMENTRTGTQRAYTLDMLRALQIRDPRVEPFNELLVQFRHNGVVRQVVPDNMFLVTPHPPVERTSFMMDHEPVGPFMMLEYVSEGSARKDYDRNMRLYSELGVPYYLIFDPQRADLEVYQLMGDDYVRLEPDTSGRVSVPEIDLQVGVLSGWLRFWHQGELLPIQTELLDAVKNKDVQIAEQAVQIDQLLAAVRQSVELLAKAKGRQDILQQLSAVDDVAQLQRWLTELSQ